MPNKFLPLTDAQIFHIYNRAVGNEKLFMTEENYRYFLKKMSQHILPVAEIWAYSLMPNHFHLLIRVKEIEILTQVFEIRKNRKFDSLHDFIPDFVMQQFSNWLNGYTKAFNKMFNRKGALFMDYTKRSIATEEYDIASYLFYIHKNAVHHGLAESIGQWKWDSYHAIMSEMPTKLSRESVLDYFGGKDAFIKFHAQTVFPKAKSLEGL